MERELQQDKDAELGKMMRRCRELLMVLKVQKEKLGDDGMMVEVAGSEDDDDGVEVLCPDRCPCCR